MTQLSASVQEKIKLEHQAAKIFMRLYEKLTGEKIRHIWHNKPIKPDVSCRLNGECLDLEIAHLYASQQEAMKILGRELSVRTRQALLELQQQSNIAQRLIEALQRILLSKAEKRYRSQQVWLVIRNAHPEWTAHFILEQLAKVQVPSSHPFEQIWLVCDFNGHHGLIQLAPKIKVVNNKKA